MRFRIARSLFYSGVLLCLLLAAYVDGHWRRLFLKQRPGPQGAVWVHGWSKRIVRWLDIACTIDGPAPGVRSMAMVSNHLSYLDILLYSASQPFVMVAKSEVRGWPLIGWITAQAGTVYVERADKKGGRTQTRDEVNAAMAKAFESGLPVLFFPEGTTSDGAGILPFRRGLFHSVVHARVPLQISAISYSLLVADPETSISSHVCYWGEMEFAPHLFRCLRVRGLHAHVRFGGEECVGSNHAALAQNAHDKLVDEYAELKGRPGVRLSGSSEPRLVSCEGVAQDLVECS